MLKKTELFVLPAMDNLDEIIRGLGKPVNLTKGKYSTLEFRIKNNVLSLVHEGRDLKDFSDVWLSSYWKSRDLAYAVKLYLEYYNVSHTFVEMATSKVTDQVIFNLNDIFTPDTFFVDKTDLTEYIETIETICEYPLIIKDIEGSGGRNSFLINNRSEFIQQLSLLDENKKYLFQRYIPNDFDWGILVANGRVVSAEKSYPQIGEFRNNSSNGATEVFVPLELVPENVKQIALVASRALNLDWSRSDIIIDRSTKVPYLMEVNRCPGISSGTSEVFGAKEFLAAYLQSNEKSGNLSFPNVLLGSTISDSNS